MSDMIGTFATDTTPTVWPKLTLAGRPFNPHSAQRNWSRCGLNDTQFVVIPFGMASHLVDAALAELVRPAPRAKAKDSSDE